MRVLVTRPADDAPSFVAALERRGHEAIWSPALAMKAVPGPELSLAAYQAVAISSANAVRALAARTQDREVDLYCVGQASAAAARQCGFRRVVVSKGQGVAGLEATIGAALRPSAGPILYPSAADVAGNLAARLESAGLAVDRQIVYQMDETGSLTPAAQDALRRGALQLATYFSARSVQAVVAAAAAAGLLDALARVAALGLSPLVAAVAAQTHPQTGAADEATQSAMLQAIDRLHVSGL